LNELKNGNSHLLSSDVDVEASIKDLGSIQQYQVRHQIHQLRNKSKDQVRHNRSPLSLFFFLCCKAFYQTSGVIQQIKALETMLRNLQRLDQNDINNALDFFRVGWTLLKLQPDHPALDEVMRQPLIQEVFPVPHETGDRSYFMHVKEYKASEEKKKKGRTVLFLFFLTGSFLISKATKLKKLC
jgi:hypothetical protein